MKEKDQTENRDFFSSLKPKDQTEKGGFSYSLKPKDQTEKGGFSYSLKPKDQTEKGGFSYSLKPKDQTSDRTEVSGPHNQNTSANHNVTINFVREKPEVAISPTTKSNGAKGWLITNNTFRTESTHKGYISARNM